MRRTPFPPYIGLNPLLTFIPVPAAAAYPHSCPHSDRCLGPCDASAAIKNERESRARGGHPPLSRVE